MTYLWPFFLFMSLLKFGILTSQRHLCFDEGHSNTPVHKVGNPGPVDDRHLIFALSSQGYTQKELAHEQLQGSWTHFDSLRTC